MYGQLIVTFLTVAAMIILSIVYTLYHKANNVKINYRLMFVIGCSWFPVGFILKNIPLIIFSTVLLFLSIFNRNKWIKNIEWNKLDKKEKTIRTILIIVTTLFLILGIAVYIIAK